MTGKKTASASSVHHTEPAPPIGSLLRLPREHIVERMLSDVNARGFDISDAELRIFMYPGPDGRRPVDLARQCHMTRQAMNYLLAGLERRGYLERKPQKGQTLRLIRLTKSGRQVFACMCGSVSAVEQEWTAYLGERRFVALRRTLQDLTGWLDAG
jgi:DNA-binding MarR family transcriptional regulator